MLEPSTMWHSMRVSGRQPSGAAQATGMAGDLDTVARKGTFSMMAHWLTAAAALACAMGCSDLDPASETYQQKYNLRPLSDRWKCIDADPVPAPMPTRAAFTYTAYVPDYRTQSAVPGVSARACLITDFACTEGVFEGTPVPPPLPGFPPGFSVTLASNFEGFVRVSAPNYLPLDYYILGPMREDVTATQAFSLVSETSAAEFLAGLGVANPLEAVSLGILAAQVFDCNNDPAPEVTLYLPDQAQQPALQSARPFATNDRLPKTNAATDDEGIAGFINLPPVNISVEAEVEGRRFGLRTFRIQPGRLTSGTIRPSYTLGY